jgi:hypothetical protein
VSRDAYWVWAMLLYTEDGDLTIEGHGAHFK